MKRKAKQIMCAACAFVVSFCIAIVAFGAVTGEYIIENDSYYGSYYLSNNSPPFVKVGSDETFVLSYYNCTGPVKYITGTAKIASLTNSRYSFEFGTVLISDSKGNYTSEKAYDQVAIGKTDVVLGGGFLGLGIRYIKLIPEGQASVYYKYTK